jgi:hypothetical protein
MDFLHSETRITFSVCGSSGRFAWICSSNFRISEIIGTSRNSPARRRFNPVSGSPLKIIFPRLKSQSDHLMLAASLLRKPP